MAGNCDSTLLHRMLVLPMTSSGLYQLPSVTFDEFDDIAYLQLSSALLQHSRHQALFHFHVQGPFQAVLPAILKFRNGGRDNCPAIDPNGQSVRTGCADWKRRYSVFYCTFLDCFEISRVTGNHDSAGVL